MFLPILEFEMPRKKMTELLHFLAAIIIHKSGKHTLRQFTHTCPHGCMSCDNLDSVLYEHSLKRKASAGNLFSLV